VFRPDKEAVLASFLRSDGKHLVIIAVSGIDDVLAVLSHDGQGRITLEGRHDAEDPGHLHAVAAVGDTFELANAAAMYQARRIAVLCRVAGHDIEAEDEALAKTVNSKDANAQWLEEWYDGLTYCTWNGLGQRLTEERILAALDSLENNNIKITGLIIDDNWQSLDNEGQPQFKRGMTDFEANEAGFPRGLRQAVSEIRQRHKSIRHVAVWHALVSIC
jgi:hypothetical protein